MQPNASCRLVVLYILAQPIVADLDELHCGKYCVAWITQFFQNEKMPFVIARNDKRHFTYLFDDRLTMR
ncbi:hypothetical protein PQR63_02840 [Herbaspirillum rhizosphaerae]|uniref:Uncharacterized protein n=1 Tax=Herbaspirillum rhizosphaerae TaxID=346179 RepID=A0ABW8Z4Y1_9BURK